MDARSILISVLLILFFGQPNQLLVAQSEWIERINLDILDSPNGLISGKAGNFYITHRSADGGFLTPVTQHLKKYAESGEELWHLQFNNDPYSVYEGRSALLSNGDIIACFLYDEIPEPEYRIYRITPEGEIRWTSFVPRVVHQEIDYRIEFYQIIPHSPNDIRLCFRMNYYYENDPPSAKNGYIRFDSLGNEQDRIYFETNGEYRMPYNIISIDDTNYLQVYRPTLPSFLLRLRYALLDQSFMPKWTFEIGPEDLGSGGPACADSAGNIYFTWNQDTTGEGGPFNQLPSIISLNAQGEWRWIKHFGEDRGWPKFRDIIYTIDGKIIACGEDGNASLSGGNYRTGWIVCISTEGTKLWERRYIIDEASDAGNDFWYIIESEDGGLILFGDLYLPPGGTDIYILKTDSEGCLTPGCELYNFTSITTSIQTTPDHQAAFYCFFDKSDLTLISNANIDFYVRLQFEVININGQVMKRGTITDYETHIELSGCIEGIYFVRIFDKVSNTIETLKVFKPD